MFLFADLETDPDPQHQCCGPEIFIWDPV